MTDMSDAPIELSEVPADLIHNDFVQELLKRLAELTGQQEEFKTKLDELKPQIAEKKKAKQDFINSINEQLAQFSKEVKQLEDLEGKITHSMNEVQNLHRLAKGELASTIDGMKAHAELAAAQDEWNAILEDQDWLWVKSIFNFQKVGCEFIASGLRRDLFGVLLADQQGLGKTLQATAAINLLQYQEDFEDYIAPRCERLPQPVELNGKTQYPPAWYSVLWVCPNSIKSSTMREIAKWSNDLKVVKLEGDAGTRGRIVDMAHQQGMVLVCSYEQLRQRKEQFLTPEIFEKDWPIVVLDEAHKFKNQETSTFTAIEKIMRRSGFVIPMTGTPIMNRPGEFWAILHMLTMKGKYEGKFDKFARFEREYLSTWGYYGQNTFSHGGYDRLIKNVQDMVLRRRKDEVLEDLPDKIREVRFVEMQGKQRELYQQMRDKLYIWLDEEKSEAVQGQNMLALLTRLRQIALLPSGVKIKHEDGTETVLDCNESAKIDEAMAVIEELLEADEKVLVFANFNQPLAELQKRIVELEMKFTDSNGNMMDVETAAIIGGVKDEDRDDISFRFNNPEDPLRVVVGNIAAMGVGLNLQGACSHAVFLDLGWNPGVNEQAEDRLHRQGQKNAVTIHIIQAEQSVDGFIAEKLETKQGIINGVIERDELRRALDEGLI